MSVIQKWLFSQPLMLNGSNPVGNWDMGSDKITIKASLSPLQSAAVHFKLGNSISFALQEVILTHCITIGIP